MNLVGIVGSSGSGKTTLIADLLPRLRARGLRISTIKHAHHGFDIDRPGKDSFIHRKAGAEEVMLVSAGRWALLREDHTGKEPSLQDLLDRMAPVDLVLVEGFRHENIPKIEVWRSATGKPPYWPDDKSIVAVASEDEISSDLLRLKLHDIDGIVDFILALAMKEVA